MTTETPTLIIGASASGLAVARCLEAAGVAALVIEAEPETGRTWRNAYSRLHLHTPRSKSALPFVPMPRSYPAYPSRQQVVHYLEYYASLLKRSPLFGRRAMSIRRDGATWRTETAQDRCDQTPHQRAVAIGKRLQAGMRGGAIKLVVEGAMLVENAVENIGRDAPCGEAGDLGRRCEAC